MRFLTESISMLNRWMNSSPPGSSRGKRKTVRWEDESRDIDRGLSSSSEANSYTGSSAGIDEKHIQEELEEESRQECVDDVRRQKGSGKAGRMEVASQTRHVTFESSVGASRPQWTEKPNTRARELLKNDFHSPAAILDDLKEPEYVCRDIEIRDGVHQMMDQIEALAREHFSFELKDKTRLRAAFESMPEETVKIIGHVASSGPTDTSDYQDLFIDSDKRQALICAIIGNVLVEQVFQHIFFGGTQEQTSQLALIQHTNRNNNGTLPWTTYNVPNPTPPDFPRNALHATKLRSFLAPKSHTTPPLHLPPNFAPHTTHITAALLTHLKPLLALHHPTPPALSLALSAIIPSLHTITVSAGLLSISMRIDAYTVYHFTPTSGEETKRMHPGQDLAPITLFPGLTAYRLGGWEKGSSRPGTKVRLEDSGVRCRSLTGAWVYCR